VTGGQSGAGGLAKSILDRGINWRIPDQHGLSERTLDCRQLSIKEILHWRGEKRLIEIFLNPFDCSHKFLLLRRSEPTLQMGWSIIRMVPDSPEKIVSLIKSVYQQEGYCILFFDAYHMPFSAYYGVYDITHWSLLIDHDDSCITLADDTGSPAYFTGNIGRIPWDQFLQSWTKVKGGGVAFVQYDQSRDRMEWEEVFRHLLITSYEQMVMQKGLDQLADFVGEVEQTPVSKLVHRLEQLEFDAHYFRRLRELWSLAVKKQVVPTRFLRSEWVEDLLDLCNCWSLIMGVLMKWKRQPERDYQEKLTGYLWEAWRLESNFINQLAKAAEVKR
jgi:hypothetical protein